MKFDDWFPKANEGTQLELFLCVTCLKLASSKEEALYYKNRVTSILKENGVEFTDDVDESNICRIRKELREA